MKIQRVSRSRISEINFDKLRFGAEFSDHMFTMTYDDGRWQNPRIQPFGSIHVHPVSASLHYGQTIFEGFKAYRGVDGVIRLFRPEMNHRRLTESSKRMCIPQVDIDTFLEAVETLLKIDHKWVPKDAKQSLYIRPVIFADEGNLDVRPAKKYQLIITTSPVGSYFKGEAPAVALKAEEKYTRATKGGTGFAKAGGNYAATFLASSDAREEGYDQVLWLDGVEHKFIEEVGQMNICFYLDGKLVTPSLRGTILPGVTRDSILKLAQDMGIECEERLISIDEVTESIENGTLNEAFGCGTAAVITGIGSIGYRGKRYRIGDGTVGEFSKNLYELIVGIQRGSVEDKFGWTRKIL